jgi:aliphatic sulfonates family ABC transporter substrate-binding protein
MSVILARRTAASLLAGMLTGLAATRVAYAGSQLRIGYQKNGALVILRQQGALEALFAPRGIAVSYVEFTSGPPMLEALNAGAVDFGATGDTPPIFAQAAGSDLLYVGAQPVEGDNQAIIVRAGGPIKTLADLRGHRLAFTRGSSAHNVVVKALAKAGLTLADIQPVPLQPPDAAAAFRNGAIDAWAIWDPFLAIAEQDPTTRVLAQATDVAPSNSFFLARRAWAESSPDQVTLILDAINKAAAWAAANPESLAGLMAQVTGVPIEAQRVAAPRGVYAVRPLDARIIAQQQDIADTFARLRIIPAHIDIRQAVWHAPASPS